MNLRKIKKSLKGHDHLFSGSLEELTQATEESGEELKNLRLQTIKNIKVSGTQTEIAIKNALLCELICASRLTALLDSIRNKCILHLKYNQAVDTLSDAGMNAVNKIRPLITYIPKHLHFAVLLLGKLKLESKYEAFKHATIDYDTELARVAAHLNQEEKSSLIKFIQTSRNTLINYSAGYYALEAQIETIRVREGYKRKDIADWQQKIINEFMEQIEVGANVGWINHINMEHGVMRAILSNARFDYDDKIAVYTAALSYTNSFGNLPKGEKNLKKNFALSPKDISPPKPRKPTQQICIEGNLSELREIDRAELTSEELFLASKAGHVKLVHYLQNIKMIKVNDLYIEVEDGKIRKPAAGEDLTKAKSSIQIAAENNHTEVVNILSKLPSLTMTAEVAESLLKSETINAKIKKILTTVMARKNPKDKLPLVTYSAPPIPTATNTAVTGPSPIVIATQYFNLIAKHKTPDPATLLNPIIELVTKIESVNPGDIPDSFTKHRFDFDNLKQKHSTLMTEAQTIIETFNQLNDPECRKQHLHISKQIKTIETELKTITTELENTLKSIDDRVEKRQKSESRKKLKEQQITKPPVSPKAEENTDEKHTTPSTPTPQTSQTGFFKLTKNENEDYFKFKTPLLEKLNSFTAYCVESNADESQKTTALHLQISAILFEITQLMEKLKTTHTSLREGLNLDSVKQIHNALTHSKGFLEDSLSLHELQILSIEVIQFSTEVIKSARSNNFKDFTQNSFCQKALAHGCQLETQKEEITDEDKMKYTFSTGLHHFLFSSYNQPLPAKMQLSALLMVRVKAKIYDGFDMSVDYLEAKNQISQLKNT